VGLSRQDDALSASTGPLRGTNGSNPCPSSGESDELSVEITIYIDPVPETNEPEFGRLRSY